MPPRPQDLSANLHSWQLQSVYGPIESFGMESEDPDNRRIFDLVPQMLAAKEHSDSSAAGY